MMVSERTQHDTNAVFLFLEPLIPEGGYVTLSKTFDFLSLILIIRRFLASVEHENCSKSYI